MRISSAISAELCDKRWRKVVKWSMQGRGRLIAGVAVSVGVGYAGVVIALIKSTSAAAAVASGLVIGGLGVIVGLLIEIHGALSSESWGVQVIQGQGALMREYEELRRTKGVTRIQAIWAARYPSTELESYFAAESADLRRTSALRIERLVASDVVNDHAREFLMRNARELPNLDVWRIKPVVLECDLCEYVHNRTTYVKALVVLGGADKVAQVAVYMDTKREPAMVGVVYALKGWWEGLERGPLVDGPD
jgi:hypothetical protein